MNEHVSARELMSQLIDRLKRSSHESSRVRRPGRPAARVRVAPAGADSLKTRFGRGGPHVFAGYAVNPADLTRRYVVELTVDGAPLQFAVADQYDEQLAREAKGDGCYGFSFIVPAESLCDATLVEARIANTWTRVGEPLRLSDAAGVAHEMQGRRGVRWIGGLRFCGWLDGAGPDVPKVSALIDGALATEAFARTWHHVGGRAKDADALPAFDLHLPPRFADGRVRLVRIVDEDGEDLPGSPLTFVAFNDGLERTLRDLAQVESEQLRGELFDRLIPASLPMSRYADWRHRFPPRSPVLNEAQEPVAVVFAGEGDEERSVNSLDAQTCANWVAAALPATGADVAFDCAQLERFLKKQASACDVVVFAPSGMQLETHAVGAFVAAYRDNPAAAAIYADFSLLGESGEVWPVLLPAFDYERMLEQGCGAYLFATRRQHLARALDAQPASLFHLFQALAGDPVSARGAVIHLPGSLGVLPDRPRIDSSETLATATAEHLRARGVEADVVAQPGRSFAAARVMRLMEKQSVSIIIPTRNQADLLRRCLETIAPAVERASAEIIVIDNDSSEPDSLTYLASIERRTARVLRVPGFFNFSRLNNIAASAANGEHLCLLNNDIEAIDHLWLEEMLGRIAEPDVGAVGATLLWPSGVVQHAGVVLGPNLGATHAFTDRLQDDCGYADQLTVAHECSAVTAACLLTRKADYLAVGGMDEVNFPVNFNDVDYCLKLRALGRRIVVSSHARLLHLESASRGSDQRPDRAGRLQRELRALRARWLETIVNDPYYSPLLSLDSIPFSALAWPPRADAARFNRAPQAVAIPPGM
jgi:GT2 family glycosyltransferase